VVFEAAQFDSYGYLFRKPFFISLDGAAQPNGIDVRGLRVGLNGAEAHVGQAYAYLDTQITSGPSGPYTAEAGQSLSSLGTVLPLEKGPDEDEFFLTFDALGANTFNRLAPATPPAPTPVDLPPASVIGVRTFDEISATMATITGVSQRDASVSATFDTIRQSLPATADIQSILASHQVAIAQLAIEYCNALIENRGTDTREEFFPAFDFNATALAAFPANENALFDPLFDSVLGLPQLASQADATAVRTELSQMINGIPGDGTRPGLKNTGANTAARTQAIAKAACAAVIGSAAMLVQ
jgi:hypothetical protein